MHTTTEHLIWDKIVSSARRRIDLNDYGEPARQISPNALDALILHVVAAFASGEDHGSIATNLRNELRHIGIELSEGTIDKVISDKHVVFSSEIYAAYLTFSMLEDGHGEAEVLSCVTDLLDTPRMP